VDALREILGRYNAAPAGARFEVLVDALGPGLRIGLLEAGARHTASREGGGWRLAIERRDAPAQGTIPGLHHVVAGGDSLWTCERGRRVARVDAGAGRIATARAVARKASHLALDERARRLFVADSEACELIALRADDLSEIARWPAPGMPQLPLVSPEGVVCVTGGATGTVTIAWPEGAGYRTLTREVGAAPHDPCLDGSGEHVFVPCAGESSIAKVRLADGAVAGRLQAGDGPSHLALHPDGSRLYSANSWDGTLSCMSVEGERVRHVASGGWAHAIDVSPDGGRVFVANFFDDTVAVFDAATLARVALLRTDAYPHGLDVSPDGAWLVATGFASDHARVFDARSLRELARLPVGRGSSHTAFAGGCAWIGCSVDDHLARVELPAAHCERRLRLD
jgi:YVTN family beta-propeller protein